MSMPNSEHLSNNTPIPHPQEDPLVGVVEVVEDQDPLLVHRNLLQASQLQEDKYQWWCQQMSKLWEDSQQHSTEIALEQTILSRKSKDSSDSIKTLQDITRLSKRLLSPSPSCTDLKSLDGNAI